MDKTPVIKKLDSSQLEAACNALIMGFSADPFQRWLMPDPTIYYKNFKKWTINTCKQSFLEEGVFGDENNYGTAVWFPPGFDIDFADVSETYKEIPKDRKAEAFKMFDMMGESRVHDAWYLEYLAVDPSKQGSGLGSLLLKESVKVIDGPFNGFTGSIDVVNEEKRKLEVMVKIFGRKTPLELSYMQVEKL